MDEAQFELLKMLVGLIGEYREVSKRIVNRHSESRFYVLQSDRDRLSNLNKKVEGIASILKEALQ